MRKKNTHHCDALIAFLEEQALTTHISVHTSQPAARKLDMHRLVDLAHLSEDAENVSSAQRARAAALEASIMAEREADVSDIHEMLASISKELDNFNWGA